MVYTATGRHRASRTRVRNSALRYPIPVFLRGIGLRAIRLSSIGNPERASFVTAPSNEVEVLPIRDFVLIDGKRGNVNGVG